MRRFFIFVFLAFLWPGVLILSGCAIDSKVARIPEPPPAVKPPPIQAKAPELPSELPALQSLPKPSEMEGGGFQGEALFPFLPGGRSPGCADGLLPGKQL